LGSGVHLRVEGVAHPFDGGVEHGDVDGGAFAGAAASQQRGKHGLRGVHACGDVGGRYAGFDCRVGRAGDGDQARLGLDEHVVGLTLFQRAAAAEPRHVDDDQFATCGTEFVSAEPQPLNGARREVLQEDVSVGDQVPDDAAPLFALEVDGQRFLATVQPHEVCPGTVDGMVVTAREIAAVDPLYLDDSSPQVAETTGGERCGDRLLDRDHRHSLEWKGHDALR
jgi:hypothetical protein